MKRNLLQVQGDVRSGHQQGAANSDTHTHAHTQNRGATQTRCTYNGETPELQCVVVCCSALQCVVVRCSVLQCVAVCCSVLQAYRSYQGSGLLREEDVWQCGAVRCDVYASGELDAYVKYAVYTHYVKMCVAEKANAATHTATHNALQHTAICAR